MAARTTNGAQVFRRTEDLLLKPWLWVIIIVALYVAIAVPYVIDRVDKSRLEERVETAQGTLGTLPAINVDQLDQGLASARAEYDQTLSQAREPVVDTELAAWVQQLAEAVGVEFLGINAQRPTTEQVEELSYSVYRFTVVVEAAPINLSGFIGGLESGYIRGLRVESVSLASRDTGMPQATVLVAISRLAADPVISGGRSE